MGETISQKPSHRLEFFIIALMIPFTYGWIENAFYGISYVFLQENLSFEAIDALFADQYYFFDSLFCMAASLIYLPWFFKLSARNRLEIAEGLREKRPPIRLTAILKWTIITLGVSGISLIWLTLIDEFTMSSDLFGLGESLESFHETWSDSGQESYIWTFLSVVALGPLVEELMFRGMQFWYAEKIRRGWFVILFTGISFGIWHGEPVQIVYTSVMGIALAIVYENAKTFFAPMFIHVLNNFMSALPPSWESDRLYEIMNLTCLIAIIPALVILFLMIRQNKKRRNAPPIIEEVQESDPPLAE